MNMKEVKLLMTAMLLLSASAFAGDWNAGPGGIGDDRAPPPPESAAGEQGGRGHGRHHGRGGPGGAGGHHGGKEAFEACASSLGITIPEKGSDTRLTDEQRESLHSCVKTAMEAKRGEVDACLKAAGVAFGENGRPSTRPTREQMEACRPAAKANGTSAL